jgi:hypothetical protein
MNAWAEQFAHNGEVRIPPRRWATALRALPNAAITAYEVASIVAAARGVQPWGWWQLFCVVAAPVMAFLTTISVRPAITGQPVLVADGTGISLGKRHLLWREIASVEGAGRRRRRAAPRRPVAYFPGFESLTLASAADRSKRPLIVGTDYVKDLDGLAAWLEEVRRQKSVL